MKSFRINKSDVLQVIIVTGMIVGSYIQQIYGTCKVQCSDTCERFHQYQSPCNCSTGECYEGCIPGFYGTSCNQTCDNCLNSICYQHSGHCTQGCKSCYCGDLCNRRCQGGGKTTCSCLVNCKICNRHTGNCDECEKGYGGNSCQYSCHNCVGQCKQNCENGCLPGYFGYFCMEKCPASCSPNPEHCRAPVDQCVSECHNGTGACIYGCRTGWYGINCSHPCNIGCKEDRCLMNGLCESGCIPGFFGQNCELKCPRTCNNKLCAPKTGTCLQGCTEGFYGMFCNMTCSACSSGLCDANGTCKTTSGADIMMISTEVTSQSGKEQHVPLGDVRTNIIIVVCFVTTSLFMIALVVALYISYRKNTTTGRRQSEDAYPQRHIDTETVDIYPTISGYYEINDEDIDGDHISLHHHVSRRRADSVTVSNNVYEPVSIQSDTVSCLSFNGQSAEYDARYLSPAENSCENSVCGQ